MQYHINKKKQNDQQKLKKNKFRSKYTDINIDFTYYKKLK